MRKELQILHDDIKDHTVFIIGGGPSVKEIDFTLLKDKKVVCINSAYKLLENPSALYWCDTSWASNNLKELANHKCKLRFQSHFSHIRKGNKKGVAGCTYLHREKEEGFTTIVDNVRGNNSGAHAINLVANMGASIIVLLGYDMRIIDRKSHWHDEYTYGLRPNVYSETFIPSITKMAKEILTKGIPVQVFNASKYSALTCFPKRDYKDFI